MALGEHRSPNQWKRFAKPFTLLLMAGANRPAGFSLAQLEEYVRLLNQNDDELATESGSAGAEEIHQRLTVAIDKGGVSHAMIYEVMEQFLQQHHAQKLDIEQPHLSGSTFKL